MKNTILKSEQSLKYKLEIKIMGRWCFWHESDSFVEICNWASCEEDKYPNKTRILNDKGEINQE